MTSRGAVGFLPPHFQQYAVRKVSMKVDRQIQESVRIIRALRKVAIAPELREKAEASVLKKLSLNQIAAVALALDQEAHNG
jgi:hypothetical protein